MHGLVLALYASLPLLLAPASLDLSLLLQCREVLLTSRPYLLSECPLLPSTSTLFLSGWPAYSSGLNLHTTFFILFIYFSPVSFLKFFYFIIYYYFFNFTILYWFCHTSTWKSRFGAGYRMLGAGALGWPRRMVRGGRWVQDWELMYTHGGFMLMYGKPIQYCKVK